MTSREHIVSEIRRIAASRDGQAPGWELFRSETRLSESSWKGRYWPRWTDALVEAGFTANVFHSAYSDDVLFSSFAAVARQHGHLPSEAEYKIAVRKDPQLPGINAFKRLGNKEEFVRKLAVYSSQQPGFEDIAELCSSFKPKVIVSVESINAQDSQDGDVYLIKSGRHYKIGRSNSAGRREREIALQLPEAARRIHTIRTDDPIGIEAYWALSICGKAPQRRVVQSEPSRYCSVSPPKVHVDEAQPCAQANRAGGSFRCNHASRPLCLGVRHNGELHGNSFLPFIH